MQLETKKKVFETFINTNGVVIEVQTFCSSKRRLLDIFHVITSDNLCVKSSKLQFNLSLTEKKYVAGTFHPFATELTLNYTSSSDNHNLSAGAV